MAAEKGKGIVVSGTWFKSQAIMRRVLLALTPALLGGIYFFGWRVAVLCAFTMLLALGSEYTLARHRGDPATESCLVTGMLLALSLPPTLPFWMAAVGIVVAICFGKEFFGGFGRNVFNPAIVGRGFLYVCFPVEMTKGFVPVHAGPAGGFIHWGPATVMNGFDAVSAATPMWSLRDYGYLTPLKTLILGNIGGRFTGSDGVERILGAGSIGEVSALLVAIGGIYLLVTKTANWRLAISGLLGAVLSVCVFRNLLGIDGVPPVLWTLCSGAMLYACFFMITDPVSAPKDKSAQLIYGAFIGTMIVFFRWKSAFAGGVGFAILLGNTVGPAMEMGIKALKASRTKKSAMITEGK